MRRKLVLIAAAAGVIVGGSGAILVRAMRDLPEESVEHPVSESPQQTLDRARD